jgi:hypothetical protein
MAAVGQRHLITITVSTTRRCAAYGRSTGQTFSEAGKPIDELGRESLQRRIIMGLKQLGGMVKDLVQRDILQEPRTCSATYFAPEEPVISKGPTIIRLGLSANLTLTKARRCQWMALSGRQSGVVVRSKRVKLGCRCAIALFGDTHA